MDEYVQNFFPLKSNTSNEFRQFQSLLIYLLNILNTLFHIQNYLIYHAHDYLLYTIFTMHLLLQWQRTSYN